MGCHYQQKLMFPRRKSSVNVDMRIPSIRCGANASAVKKHLPAATDPRDRIFDDGYCRFLLNSAQPEEITSSHAEQISASQFNME